MVESGRKVVTTAGTSEVLGVSDSSFDGILITAETDNTGTIVVGGVGVIASLSTREGTPLLAGESININANSLADIYLDSTVSGDGVTYSFV